MKLRYYMRGLGIGMLVAALILILSGNTGKRITDEEIKKRAAELGMVADTKEVLADMEKDDETQAEQETQLIEDTPKEQSEEVVTEELKEQTTEKEPEETEEQSIEKEPEETEEQLIEESPEEQKKKEIEELKKAAEEVAEKAQNMNPNGVVSILVQSGDSSVAVAKRAEAAGLVESAEAFDRYLCQNGYDKAICVGNYEVPLGATQEQIAKIITRRQ